MGPLELYWHWGCCVSELIADRTADQDRRPQPAPTISSTRRKNTSGRNGFDKYGCPAPSSSLIRSGFPVIIRVFVPAVSACCTRLVLEPSISTIITNKSGTSPSRRLVASETVATAVAREPACSNNLTS